VSGATHYAGGLTYESRRSVVIVIPGFPVCCSGARAVKIAESGMQRFSRDSDEITCRRCLSLILRGDKFDRRTAKGEG
jgi:hypothetical protein